MTKCRKVKSRLAAVVLVFMAGAALLFVFTVKYDQGKEEDWGIPDAVSTVSDGETCRLTVVANCREIEDCEMFAENVIRMYTENAFRSIRISDDLEGWASLIAMALVFGLVAGGTMFGVNTAAEHLTGRDKAQIGQTQTTSASSSGSSNSSGQGTVSEVAANAMPSLVTISTMTVEEMRNFFGAGKSI